MGNGQAQRLERTGRMKGMRTKRKAVPGFMPLRIFIYADPDNDANVIAHCLDLDVIGYGKNVEDAMLALLALVDSHVFACEQTGADMWFPAPAEIWQKFVVAFRENRKLPDELNERILARTEAPCGYLRRRNLENTLGSVVATKEVHGCLAGSA